MRNLFHLTIPKFSLFVLFIKKPITIIAAVPAIAVVPVINLYDAAFMLFILFLIDLFTGLLASWFTWRKSDHKEKWFFGKGEGFSSDKFKKCFLKAIVYAGTPLVIQKFQQTFMIKNLRYESISDAEIGIATFLIVIFCLNEGYSIFHENLPKCGFNLWERIKKMIGFYKEAKKEITE